MLFLYMYHVVEKYHNIKWLKIEMIAYVVLAFLNVIAASIAVAFGSAAFSAAGVRNFYLKRKEEHKKFRLFYFTHSYF